MCYNLRAIINSKIAEEIFMSLNYITIGKRIREIRKKRKISQSALSEIIDKTPTLVSYIESGIRGMSLETIVAIANALEVSVDVLLSDNLAINSRSFMYDISEIMSGLTVYERTVIIESMKSLKETLRENRYLIANRPK